MPILPLNITYNMKPSMAVNTVVITVHSTVQTVFDLLSLQFH